MSKTRDLVERLPPPVRERLRAAVIVLRRLRQRPYGPGARWIARRGISLTNRTLSPHNSYVGLHGISEDSPSYERDVNDRWHLIAPQLPPAGTGMDLGCHNGRFTFNMAEAGLLALGVEREHNLVRTAQWLTLYNQTDRAAFVQLDLTPDTVRQLPTTDVVLCLSVFHHWVRFNDLDYGRQIMQGIADRCRDRLFFDTGQPNESESWSDQMSFMGDRADKWLEEFLLSLGFDKVVHLGDTGGFKNKSFRHLMMATR